MALEKKLKHLDFIQLVITRMNVNSFLIKGWAVTIVAAMFAFAAKDANAKYVFIPVLTSLVFWMLDGYYLSLERQYRCLYDKVRELDESSIDLSMNASMFNNDRNTWLYSSFTLSLVIFYITLLMLTGVVAIVLT